VRGSGKFIFGCQIALPLGTLEAGAEMKAHFAMFFVMREGKIALQRNYDCFEAWQVSECAEKERASVEIDRPGNLRG